MCTFTSILTRALQINSLAMVEEAMAEHNRLTEAENIVYWKRFDEIRRTRKEMQDNSITAIYIDSLKYDMNVINRDQGRRTIALKRYTDMIMANVSPVKNAA
jgi:hypothetical protein